MSLKELGIRHKIIGDMRIASIRFKMRDHQEIGSKIEEIARECKDILNGPPMSVYDYGLGTARGIDTEVCFPVTEPIEKGEIKSRTLAGGEALTILHRGSHDTLKDSWQRLWDTSRNMGYQVQPSRGRSTTNITLRSLRRT